ncbi:MAG: polysaccharide deacetylase family protein [Myxococcales bacterium]|nr:polysaccharide deacetylase family protein [Myxococcales bacterium]
MAHLLLWLRAMRTLWCLPLLAALAPGCGEPGEEPLLDDPDFGDTLEGAPEGSEEGEGKEDGFGVPGSLGLNKQGVIYLTFDDGPSPALTPRILDVLSRHQIKATFFVTGTNIAGNEKILRRERDEGHIVANHQWQHIQASPSQFATWVPRERDVLRQIVGEMPLYFRYPYGAMTGAKEAILRQNGYRDGGIGWDMDSLDWDFGSDGIATRTQGPANFRADYEGWVIYQAQKRGGGVILMHDIQSITAQHLDSILARLKAKGFRFGQLPRGGPKAGGFIGDACKADSECGFDGAFCLSESGVPSGYCTRACTGSCPDRAGYPTTRCVRAPDGTGSGAKIDVCALECAAGCRAGVTCQSIASPAGPSRSVCWGK